MSDSFQQAALYARVSSSQQAETNTIASQVAALEARIQADGFQLPTEFYFLDEGHSGSTLFRPALERLRDQAAAGVIDRLDVHSPDRLARNYAHQFLLIEELRRGGIEIVFLNRPIGQSPEDDLLLQMQGMMAEYERAKILERSRRGKRHAAQAGSVNVLGGAPYGYTYIDRYAGGGQARYQVQEEQARVVRQIFAWVGLEGCSLGEVYRRLKSQKIPSPKGKSYWDRSTIWGILKNPAYKGEAHFGKTRVGPLKPRLRSQRSKPMQPRRAVSVTDTPETEQVVIPVPSLIEAELFEAVAEQLEENRRRRRESHRGARYLLQGLLVCGCCRYAYYGKPLSRASRKGKTRDYAYYRCIGTDAYRFGGLRVCTNSQCRTDMLDQTVWADVCSLLADPGRVRREYEQRRKGKRNQANRGTEQVGKLIAKVRRGIARLIDAYEEGLLQKEEFEPRIQASRQRLNRLEEEAKRATEQEAEATHLQEAVEGLETFAQQVGSGLQKANWEMRRGILRALIKEVEVGTEVVRIVYKVSPLPFELGPSWGISQDCWRGD
jgi:site-specific DNA recombinase